MSTKFVNSGVCAIYVAIAFLHSFDVPIGNILKADKNVSHIFLNMFCHQAHLKLKNCINQYAILENAFQPTALSNHQKPNQRIFLKFLQALAFTASINWFFTDWSILLFFINASNASALPNCIKEFSFIHFKNAIFLKFLANIQSIILLALSL